MKTESDYLDMNGKAIQMFDDVNVPEPKSDGSDLHNFDFVGMVDGFRNGNVIVVDGDGDCFEIEPERLEIEE